MYGSLQGIHLSCIRHGDLHTADRYQAFFARPLCWEQGESGHLHIQDIQTNIHQCGSQVEDSSTLEANHPGIQRKVQEIVLTLAVFHWST